jgi:hypothetical protein
MNIYEGGELTVEDNTDLGVSLNITGNMVVSGTLNLNDIWWGDDIGILLSGNTATFTLTATGTFVPSESGLYGSSMQAGDGCGASAAIAEAIAADPWPVGTINCGDGTTIATTAGATPPPITPTSASTAAAVTTVIPTTAPTPTAVQPTKKEEEASTILDTLAISLISAAAVVLCVLAVIAATRKRVILHEKQGLLQPLADLIF